MISRIGRASVFALLGLGAALCVVWGASAFVVDSAYSDSSNTESRFQSAERLLFYRLEPGESLRLLVPPDADTIRVFSHMVLPTGTAVSPELRFAYGLGIKLWDPEGKQLLDRELYTRTRQTRANDSATATQRSVMLTDARAEVTDGRDFLLRLPPNLNARATSPALLIVQHNGGQSALLVRVSARFAQVARIVTLQNRSAVDRAMQRVEQATFIPWDKLPEQTQTALSAESWQRLGAQGELGSDYRVEPVYRTNVRAAPSDADDELDSRLAAQSAVPVNVQGPASVGLRVWIEKRTTTGKVQVSQRATDATERRFELLVQDSVVTTETVEVGPGLHTLTLHNATGGELRYQVLASSRAKPGAPPDATEEIISLWPERTDADAWLVEDGAHAFELEVPAEGAQARLMRLDARAVALGSEALAQTTVTLKMVNGHGAVVAQTLLPLSTTPAPFDGLTIADEGSVDVEGRVGEASVGRLFIPAGVRRLLLTADRRAAVQLSAWLPSPVAVQHRAPYVDDVLQRTRWRAAPLQTRSWFPVRPSNHAALRQLGARAQLWSYVRLEPVGGEASTAPGGMKSIKPSGRPSTVELLEPVAATDAADVKAQLWSELRSSAPSRVLFPAGTAQRPSLRLFAPASALGRPLELLVDGKILYRKPLRSTRETVLLPPIAPGEHQVELRGAAVTALLNRPLADESGLKPRTVFQLTDKGLRVRLHKPTQAAVTLNVLVYSRAPEATGTQLKLLLDDGEPRRLSGVLLQRVTVASREVPLPKSERAAGLIFGRAQAEAAAQWYGRALSITLGEDLPPGAHWVDVRPLSASAGPEELWARFFVQGAADAPKDVLQWTRPGFEGGGAL